MPIFVLFAKDSVEWPETGKQGGDLPLQRGQKYRNNGKSAAPKAARRAKGGRRAAAGQETAKSLAAKAAGKRRAFCGVRTRKLCRKIWQKRAAGCVAAAWRPQRTPAFRRLAIDPFLRFSGASQFCCSRSKTKTSLCLLRFAARAVLCPAQRKIQTTLYYSRFPPRLQRPRAGKSVPPGQGSGRGITGPACPARPFPRSGRCAGSGCAPWNPAG